jgi:PAS domain S-box-containing protein
MPFSPALDYIKTDTQLREEMKKDELELRKRAEEALQGQQDEDRELSKEEMQHLIHELRVHQVELDMQNEELRRVQLEIEASRNRYSDLYDFAPVGYITASEKGLILEANLTICSMLGVERNFLIKKPFSRFITNETQDTYYFHRQKLFETKGKQTSELKLIRKDGTQFEAQLESIAIEDGKGNITQIRAAITDITDRKMAEEALRESEEKYRDLFNNAPNVYFSISAINGSIFNCNDKAVQLLGYDREMLLGMKILDLYANTSDGLPKATEIFNRIKEGESIRDVELQMKHKDGHPIWISLSVDPVKNREGDIIESRSVVIDISERKRFESQLRKAQKMEAIGTLIGGIAHQFITALSVVSLNLEAIEMGRDDKEMLTEHIDEMNRSVDGMLGLTNQLLAYARGGKHQITKIALSDLIKMSLSLLNHVVGPPVELKTESSCDTWRVNVDITQMQMVLVAIIKNAADSIEGDGCISISCQEAEITNEMEREFPGMRAVPLVCLSIEDNGKGMDEETKNRIFEPFFTTQFLGRGLGMAAAYGIVKNHDGFIFVDSELGQGTVVRIYLPVLKNHIEET